MVATYKGPISWKLVRDDQGHRIYTLTSKVLASTKDDGPYTIMNAAGLPSIGSIWYFGNDMDQWAWCRPNMTVTPHPDYKDEPVLCYHVEQTFSTKPIYRCMDSSVEDPLLEPVKVSGTFKSQKTEATQDRYSNLLLYSNYERIQGPEVEFDETLATVRVEQNLLTLGLSTFAYMVNTVNSATLWGMPKRCIKLSATSWERKMYGQCCVYYTRIFDFDINPNTFDQTVPDAGTKVLNGRWGDNGGPWELVKLGTTTPVVTRPDHFCKAIDRNDNPTRLLLNGAGMPLADGANPVTWTIEKYGESNFLTLGVPTSF